MPLRLCLGYRDERCTKLTPGTRCPGHQRRYEQGRRPTGWQRYPAQYQANRTTTLAASRTCWLCGHDGADQADHVVARQHGGGHGQLRPAHGTQPCPTCGVRCNQVKGDRDADSDGQLCA